MRFILALFLLFAAAAPASPAGEDAGQWLDRAADAGLPLREREYAARQVLMLADPSASILIAALGGDGSDSGLRRQVAAGLLSELAVETAEAPLLEAAFGEDYFLAEAAAGALARLYARLPDRELYRLYRTGSRDAGAIPGGAPPEEDDFLALSLKVDAAKGRFRSFILRGLALKYADAPDPLPTPLAECVFAGLLDDNVDLRKSAVALTTKCATGKATEKLALFLFTENNPLLLAAALRAMGEMRPPEYGEAVERHVGHSDPMVQLEALAALDAMGYRNAMFPPAPGVRAAASFVAHPSTPVRRRAMEILGATKNPAALEYLLAGLFDRVGQNRAVAAGILGDLGFAGAVGGLTPLLRDGRPDVRQAAAVALDKLGVMGVASGALDDLAGGSAPFRLAAAKTLGQIRDRRAVPALLRALGDDDLEAACAAADALGAIRDKSAGQGLYESMISEERPAVADAARNALTLLYGDDPGYSRSSWNSWFRRNGLGAGQ